MVVVQKAILPVADGGPRLARVVVKVEGLQDVVHGAHKGQAGGQGAGDPTPLHRAPVAVAETEKLQAAGRGPGSGAALGHQTKVSGEQMHSASGPQSLWR